MIVGLRLIIDFFFLGLCLYDILIFDVLIIDLGMLSFLIILFDVFVFNFNEDKNELFFIFFWNFILFLKWLLK